MCPERDTARDLTFPWTGLWAAWLYQGTHAEGTSSLPPFPNTLNSKTSWKSFAQLLHSLCGQKNHTLGLELLQKGSWGCYLQDRHTAVDRPACPLLGKAVRNVQGRGFGSPGQCWELGSSSFQTYIPPTAVPGLIWSGDLQGQVRMLPVVLFCFVLFRFWRESAFACCMSL